MATRFVENVGATAGDAATELSRLKDYAGSNVCPVVVDAVDGVLKYWDRVNSKVQQVVTPTATPVTVTASALTVTSAVHAGRTVVLNRAAGVAVTLPAATGSGDKYRFIVLTTASGGSYTIAVPNATDYMIGVALESADDATGTAKAFATANTGTVATESDTITLNGTTTMGIKGTIVELQDIASAVWEVKVAGQATGTEATPFSAAV